MRVLTRKVNDAMIIDHNIEIDALEILSSSVRIGINAPRDVSILRAELCMNSIFDHEQPNHAEQVVCVHERMFIPVANVLSNQCFHDSSERLRICEQQHKRVRVSTPESGLMNQAESR